MDVNVSETANTQAITKDGGWKTYFYGITAAMLSLTFGVSLTVMECISWMKSGCTMNQNTTGFDVFSSFSMFNNCISINEREWALVVAILSMGALISNLGIQCFKKATFRQKMIFNNLLYIIGHFLVFIMVNPYLVLVGRFFIGLGIGVTCAVVPLYLNKIAPENKTGFFMFMHAFGISGGVLIGQILAYNFSNINSWQVVFGVNIGCMILHTAFLFVIKDVKEGVCQTNTKEASLKELITSSYIRKGLLLSIFAHFTQQFSGMGAILFYVEHVLQNEQEAKFYGVIIGIISALCVFTTSFLADYFKKKNLLLVSCATTIAGLYCIFDGINPYVSLPTYIIGYNIGLGPIIWMMTTELLPQRYQSIGSTVAIGVNWMSGFVFNFIFPLAREVFGPGVFLICGFIVLMFGLCVLGLYKEPAGDTIEEGNPEALGMIDFRRNAYSQKK